MLETVYKLYNPNSDFVYIGSTINYTNRKSLHKFSSKLGNSGNKLYEFIRNNGGFNTWKFKICEEIMVSKPHCPKLLKLEKKYCDKYENTLNQREILRDKKKYYIDHRQKIIARSKLDEIINKERNPYNRSNIPLLTPLVAALKLKKKIKRQLNYRYLDIDLNYNIEDNFFHIKNKISKEIDFSIQGNIGNLSNTFFNLFFNNN